LEPTKTQFPATIQQAEVTADQRVVHVVPALVADLGDEATWRYVEFFTANIRNPNTRRAYLRACNRFLSWCEDRGLTLGAIRPHDVAIYIEELQAAVQAPSIEQQLAAIRMLFNWLVTGQVVPNNPATAVRAPKHVVKTGKTPVLEADAWRKLLKIDPDRDIARSPRPGPDCDADLLVRSHHRSFEDEGRGFAASRRRVVGSLARERW
jgi:Phage integrase, N-terminal SAM-like domain